MPTSAPGLSLKIIAIVGAGLSGTLVAANLLRLATSPVRVVLIERRAQIGQGVAYGTLGPDHLLNVPADRMGVWPDDPEHFLRWLRAHRGEPGIPARVEPGDFLPRCLYGAYVGRVFAEVRAAASPVEASGRASRGTSALHASCASVPGNPPPSSRAANRCGDRASRHRRLGPLPSPPHHPARLAPRRQGHQLPRPTHRLLEVSAPLVHSPARPRPHRPRSARPRHQRPPRRRSPALPRRPAGWLFTIGAPMKGQLWETTAAPEIRIHARALAATLRAAVPAHVAS